jgi:hypothetical protein
LENENVEWGWLENIRTLVYKGEIVVPFRDSDGTYLLYEGMRIE